MKSIPDFNVELSQVLEYIFNSDLAKKAFKNPPLKNYTNILRETIVAIDRLADNCHMPEFTNHALPHICSVVKRASEWAVNEKWIGCISSKEAGYLLLALIIHDMGMLSQDPSHLPDDELLLSKKGIMDTPNWVRSTHVRRLKKLFKEIIKEEYMPRDEMKIELIAEMAATHALWPWKKEFNLDNVKCENAKIDANKAEALCAVIAVVDLLDEDSARCDTETLIRHRKGTIENISHWLRHALTIDVSPINQKSLKIKLRNLPHVPKTFEVVFRILRNHYKLIQLYNEKLKMINAEINTIEFSPSNGMPNTIDEISEKLANWKDDKRLKYDLTNLITDTFMLEAKAIPTDPITYKKLIDLGLETIPILNNSEKEVKDIEQKIVLSISDKNKKEALLYLKSRTENAYLEGNIGTVRYLSYLALENIDYDMDLTDIYWVLTFIMIFMKDETDFRSLMNFFHNDGFKKLLSKNYKMECKIGPYDYKCLFDLAFNILHYNFSDISELTNFCCSISVKNLNDDIATALLIEHLATMLFIIDIESNSWIEFLQYYIEESKRNNYKIFDVLCECRTRMNLQKSVFSTDEKLVTEDNIQDVFANAWNNFYNSKWVELEISLSKLTQKITINDDYAVSLIGFTNMMTGRINLQNHESFVETKKSNYLKYQKMIIENPRGAFINALCAKVESIIAKTKISPQKATAEHKELLKYVMLSFSFSLKYWDLGLYLKVKEYFAEYCVFFAAYLDKRNYCCGEPQWCKDSIINSIQSLSDKLVDNTQMKTIVGAMEIYKKDMFIDVYKYIFEDSKKAEWYLCANWLEVLEDNLPENHLDYFINWTLEFNNFTGKEKYRWKTKKVNYMEKILVNYSFTHEQWERLKPICDYFLLYSSVIQSCGNISILLLEKMPIQMCEDYLEIILAKCIEMKNNEDFVPNLIYNASVSREELLPLGISFLTRFVDALNYLHGFVLIDYLSNPLIAQRENVEGNKIIEEFENDILRLSSTQTNGVSMHIGDTFFYRNINWEIVDSDIIEKIFVIFEECLQNKFETLDDSYFEEILSIMSCIILNLNNKYKNRYVNFLIAILKTKKQTNQNLMAKLASNDSPLNAMRFNIPIINHETSAFLFNLCEFIRNIDDENLPFVINWCLENFPYYEKSFLYFYQYIFSYLFLTKTETIKGLAYSGLLMLKTETINLSDPEFTCERLLKGIYHVIMHPMNKIDNESLLNLMFNGDNTAYCTYMVFLLERFFQSIIYGERMACAEIVNVLVENKECTIDLFAFIESFKKDSRMSIRKLFQNK